MAAVAVLSGCGAAPLASSATAPAKVDVVAVEDFWGSIARQIGGEKAAVTSLISSPDADPHDYEPTAHDARAVAAASLVIVNGLGYDSWAKKLLAANRTRGRVVVDVGDVVHLKEGDNPHRWYSPDDVDRVTTAVGAAYARLRPGDAAYFDHERDRFEGVALGEYHAALDDIRTRFAGQAVGASESVVAPLAQAVGLRLLTPPSFLNAISEGSEPSAADKATIDRQIATHAIKVFVFNSQNATPDVRRLVDAAAAQGIPVVSITETLTPAGTTFQSWQTSQLRALDAALARAADR